MKFHLKTLSLAISVAMLSSVVNADEATDAKVAKLEQQVQSLQQQQASSLADKFTVNGFVSGAYVSSDNKVGYNGANTSANFKQDSKMGIQGTFNISDQTQAVVQLMMKGQNDWDVRAEWAYLSHRLDNGVKIRGGKLRVPLFMYSDFLDVGYAQPFARPPTEVYSQITFSSYTGGDLSYDFEYDNSSLTMQAFGGQSKVEVGESDIDISNMIGMNLTWTDMTWTVRAVYGQSELDGTVISGGNPLFAVNSEKGVFNGVGASYDNGSFLATAEWTSVEIDGLLGDTDSGYITMGYRIEEFTPYVTVAYVKTTDEDIRAGLPPALAIPLSIGLNEERTAYSLGLRWDVIDNVALKFDVTYATDFGNTNGGFGTNPVVNPLTRQFMYDDTTIYTVKFDAVF